MSKKPMKHHSTASKTRAVQPFGPRVKKVTRAVHVVAPQPFVTPAHPKQQQSRVLHRQTVKRPQKHIVQEDLIQPFEDFAEPVQQNGKLKSALQSCFGLFA